ncbi:MAG: hypothetical protein M0002_11850 [Rhodospirillales bacterium]|nr:hypothetical protein [Rhodospirillales bacterium]
MSRAPLLAVLFAGALALAGCAATPPPPVPPAKSETIPLPPVAGGVPQIWEPGHWDWNGQGYDWVAGKWIPRDGHPTTFMPGYWAKNPNTGTWTWQPGHWAKS